MVFSVTTDASRDGTTVISPSGEVDLGNAFRIREAVDVALIGPKPVKIVIDLSAVTLIDSAGVSVLVTCYHAAAASGVALAAAEPSCAVYRQLWLAGVVGLFGLATPRPQHAVAAA